jgi:zinc protease
MYTSQEYITVSANCLARYFDETVALVEEMLLEPRWDEEEFARIKTRQINNIKQRSSNPNAIASQVSDKILYGDGHIFSQPIGGSVESVEKITIDDLKAYYENNFAPNISAFHIAGNVSESDVKASLSSMNEKWAKKEVAMPEYTINDVPEDVKVYFANFSNAKQSVIRIQRMAVKRNDPDYFPLTVANYGLGGNSGALLFQELREKRQYTYGAYSNVGSSMEKAPFSMYSSVKTNVTPDAVAAFKEVLMDYMQNYDSAELEKARTALIRQEARAYETLYDKLGILQSISTYNLPNDYIRKNQEELKGYTIDDMKEVMNKYMNPEELSYFVVGDAATQLEGVRNLEIGEVIRVDENGNPVDNVIEKK